MPKLTNSLPKYRKHRATGRAVVTLDGKDHYLGPHGTKASKTEYDRLTSIWLANGRSLPREDHDETITVVEVLAAFWKHAKAWYVKNGQPTNELDAYRNIIKDVKALYADLPASSFGPLAFKSVRQIWIDRGQSRPTVNKNAGRLKRLFKWAAAEELIRPLVYQSLATVDGLRKGRCDLPEPSPIQPVSLDAVEATIRHLPDVTADMIRFQLLTGARPGEACKLTPEQVDRAGDVWEYRVEGHKTEHHGRSRTVFIGPEAQAILTPYLLRDSTTVCFSMAESLQQRRQARHAERTTPLSCGNRPGKRSNTDRAGQNKPKRIPKVAFDASSYRHAIHAACDDAFPPPEPLRLHENESKAARSRRLSVQQREELDAWQREHRWHPNQLRHTKGTEIRKQYGLEGAQVILGHAAADVTQIYAERDADKAREIARAIG